MIVLGLVVGFGCARPAANPVASPAAGSAARTDGSSWPKGESPREIGQRVAERFVDSALPDNGKVITYPEACTWYGALTFARLSGNQALTDRLIRRFEPLLTPAAARLVPRPLNVDASVFGIVPLEIYIQTGDPRCLKLGRESADQQWAPPANLDTLKPDVRAWVARDLSPQTRFWIDDMYMIIALQTQAFRATGDTNYLDRAAREMVAYLDELQQTNGLFYHAPDVPFYWGRGNGWMAAGMSELLRSLPENHPQRARILAGYRKLMAALLRYQDADGMWHQLVDHPEAWPETSCTGMFTFALVTGAKNGWLDEKEYGPAARKGWLALVGYLDADAAVRNVCEGTGKRNDLDYYLTRARKVGDLHGQAPILWCASAWMR